MGNQRKPNLLIILFVIIVFDISFGYGLRIRREIETEEMDSENKEIAPTPDEKPEGFPDRKRKSFPDIKPDILTDSEVEKIPDKEIDIKPVDKEDGSKDDRLPTGGEEEKKDTDVGMPDFGMPDFGIPDFGIPDLGIPDFGIPKFGNPWEIGKKMFPQFPRPSIFNNDVPFQGGFMFDSPFKNFKQVENHFKNMERAMDNIFRNAMANFGNTGVGNKNTSDEVIEIDGKKYDVHTSVMNGGNKDSSIFIKATSIVPLNKDRKRRSVW